MSAEDVEALNGLGVAYGDAGRYGDAIGTFKKVLVLDPTNGLALSEPGVDDAAAGAGDEAEPERRAASLQRRGGLRAAGARRRSRRCPTPTRRSA